MEHAGETQIEQFELDYRVLWGAVCTEHIRDQNLIKQLIGAGVYQCGLCGELRKAFTMTSLQEAVVDAVQYRYEPADLAGVPYDRESGEYIGAPTLETDEMLQEIFEQVDSIEDEILWNLISLMAPAFNCGVWTPKRDSGDLESFKGAWQQFEKDVKTSSRFVFFNEPNGHAPSPSTRSADFLRQLRHYRNPNNDLITTIPTGKSFYRGRLTDTPFSKLKTAKELGPTPAHKATANRMSPVGIPMFYASAKATTAVGEIAAHGMYTYARIGAFKNQRPLTVLDLTKLPKPISPFDAVGRRRDGLFKFFRDFASNVTKPVIPDGRHHVDYVPTQVVTEFFRWAPGQLLDGIKLKSSQDDKDTFVLFFTEDDVADLGAPAKNLRRSNSQEPYTFLLDPEGVQTYKVIRKITASPWPSKKSR